MKRVEFLQQIPLFAGMNETQLQQIAQEMVLRRFEAAAVIFREGEPGHALYLIKSGQVRIFVHGLHGNETSVMLFGQPGEMFGELAIIDGLPRSATAVALRHTYLYSLSSQMLYQQVQQCSRLALNFLNEMCQRLRYNTRHMSHLASLDIPQRLAHTLIDLAQAYGQREVEGVRINLSLTQDDLASLVSATRESVNKNLRDFRRQEWILVQHKQITILDLEALRVLAAT